MNQKNYRYEMSSFGLQPLGQSMITNNKQITRWLVVFILFFSAWPGAQAQISFTSSSAVTQNFDGLGSSATASLPSGWVIGTDWSTGTTATTVAAGTSGTGILTSTSSGGIYNFANGVTASSTDRALGFLTTGSFSSPRSIILKMVNNTSSNITALSISWNYEKYRSGSRQCDWTFFHGSTTAPTTAATDGNQSYPADAGNTVISNPPLSVSKSVSLTGLSIAPGGAYYIRWTYTGLAGSTNTMALGIDEFSITPTLGPSITTSAAALSAFTTIYGAHSATQTFDVSGSNLTEGIKVKAPNGFQVSVSSVSGFADSIVVGAAGTVSATPVYVRLDSTFVPGSYSGNVSCTSAGAPSKTVSIPTSTVNTRTLNVTGVVANSKTYNAGTSTTLAGTAILNGTIIGTDDVSLSGSPAANFATASVGTAKPVTVTGYTLSGAQASRYSIAQPSGLSADINKKDLTITGISVNSKTFDSTATATLAGTATLVGVEAADVTNVTLGGTITASFSDMNAGIAKSVTVSGYSISGSASGNYNLIQPSGFTADINKANQTITFGALPSMTVTDPAFKLTATASSGLPISYSSSAASVAIIFSGDSVSITGPGTTVISASQSGDANYNAASIVNQNLVITSGSLSNQTIDFAPLSPVTYGDAPFSLTATATSGLTVTYASSNTAVAQISGSTITIVGAGSATITASQAGNSSYNPAPDSSVVLVVNQKTLTISGATANNKIYDRTTAATISGGSLVGVVGADNVTFSGAGSFADFIVANGVAVTTSLTLGGTHAANYLLTQPTGLTANITPKSVNITGISVSNKTYDGFATASITGTPVVTGLIAADIGFVFAGGAPTAVFADANAGNGKAVTISGYTVTGSASGNYSVIQPSATANILPLGLTITGLTADNKVYNANNVATLSGTPALSGVLPQDASDVLLTGTYTATFASTTPANGIAVTVSGYTISGAASGNYSLSQPTGLTANITKATLTISGITAASKVYNATTSTTISGTPVLNGIIGVEVVGVTGTAVANFVDANVGIGKTVNVTGYSLNGTNAGNYALTAPVLTADITQATQVVTFNTLPTRTVGDVPFILRATSTFNMPIIFLSDNPSVINITNDTVANIVGIGSANITARQVGDANVAPKDSVQPISVHSLLAAWEFTGLSNGGPSPNAATRAASNTTIVGLTRGSGVAIGAAGNVWGGQDMTTTSLAAAIAANDFFSWSVTANPGYQASFQQIGTHNLRHSSTGPTSAQWQYSIGAGAFNNIGGTVTIGANTGGGGNLFSPIKLDTIPALQNVAAGTAINFRIVAWGGSAATGSFYLNGFYTGDDFAVNGTISCVTPSTPTSTNPAAVCQGNSATIIGAGDATTYTYWDAASGGNQISAITSPPGTVSGNNLITANTLTPGTYTYYVQGENGTCLSASRKAVTVTIKELPTITSTTDSSRCGTGSVTLLATASSGATVEWYAASSGGTLLGSGTTFNTPGIAATTIYYAGAFLNGCSSVSRTAVTATVKTPPTASITASGPLTFCAGGSVTLTANGGDSYLWSNTSTSTSIVLSAAGSYTVTATSLNGCSNTSAPTVVVVNALPVLICSNTNVTTTGGNNGTASVSVTGGVAPYNYLWSTSETVASIDTLVAGAYTVTVSDANGCIDSCTSNVIEVTGLSANCTVVRNVPCFGGNNGQAAVVAANGTAPYAYAWTGPNSYTSSNQFPADLSVGTYNVVVTDSNNNTATCSVTLIQAPAIVANATGTAAACMGGTISLTGSASGGTGTLSYSWTGPNAFTASGNAAGRSALTLADAGAYVLYVSDDSSCVVTDTVIVIVNALPSISVSAPDSSICAGTSVVLTASGALSYLWTPSSTLSANSGTSVTATPVAQTTYTALGTDANGCLSSGTLTISINTLPTVSATATPATICLGQSAILNGSGAVSYTWSPGATLSATSGTSVTATPSSNTTYTVTGTDANGCVGSGTVTVTVTAIANPTTPAAAATGNNGAIRVSWTNPASCFDEIMIVAAPALNTGTPSGDGSAYTANSIYGSGTTVGNGFVVYKGTSSPQIFTGMTNGSNYFFKLWTRKGSVWSSGTTDVNASPALFPNLIEVFVPRFMGGAAGVNRLTIACFVTLSGLTPNASYRYFNQMVSSTDASSATGAGAPIFVNANNAFVRAGSGSLASIGSFSTFTTDANGQYSGWFMNEPSNNTRFNAGNDVFFRIVLNNGAGGSTNTTFLTTTSPTRMLTMTNVAGANNCTGVRGLSSGSARNFVVVYDNVAGTGRPLTTAVIETDSLTVSSSFASYYINNVDGIAGAYGFAIPNTNPNGVRRIEQRHVTTGALVECAETDADGIWPSGANTVNPLGGTTAIVLTNSDADLLCAPPNTITTGAIASSSFCVDAVNAAAVTVPFVSTDIFTAGNQYRAQLSDAAGSFSSPVQIGFKNSTANTDTILAIIPAGTAPGNNYRIRVVSTNPAVLGTDNGIGLQITSGSTTFYGDADGDGFGDPFITTTACAPIPGYVSNSTDCDDFDPGAYPGATEVCNSIDDNCNTIVDDIFTISGFTPVTGPVGTVVTVTGTGFTAATGADVNGLAAAYSVVSDTVLTLTVPTGASSGLITLFSSTCSLASADSFHVTVPTNATLNLTFFIQGFYSSPESMQAVLFNTGSSTNATDVDSVTIELHNATTLDTDYSTSGVLQTDGSLSVTFPAAVSGNDYYIVVRHRNSIETWSKNPVTFGSVTNFDFAH